MTITTATPTATTETFTVTYRVDVYFTLQVERPSDTKPDDIITSITRDEIVNAEEDCDGLWDGIKEAWRNDEVVRIENEQGDNLI